MTAARRLADDTILTRTSAGQREALVEGRLLDEAQRRLLLLVNGFTPLGGLIDRLPFAADLYERVGQLLDDGLVAPVDVVPALAVPFA